MHRAQNKKGPKSASIRASWAQGVCYRERNEKKIEKEHSADLDVTVRDGKILKRFCVFLYAASDSRSKWDMNKGLKQSTGIPLRDRINW